VKEVTEGGKVPKEKQSTHIDKEWYKRNLSIIDRINGGRSSELRIIREKANQNGDAAVGNEWLWSTSGDE